MFSFLFVESFNLLELVLWCVATGVVILNIMDYYIKKEKKKNKALEQTLTAKMQSVKGHPANVSQKWVSSKDIKELVSDETVDDLEMLDL